MALLKLFQSQTVEDDPRTEVGASVRSGEGLEDEFAGLIQEQLLRGGISDSCVTVEVKCVGESVDGRRVYMGMLRLSGWEPVSALRLLLGLPLLQAKIRKAVRKSWLHELSHFAGLWLHPSGQVEDASAMSDLRNMIVQLERMHGSLVSTPAQASVWSVPQEFNEDDRIR